MVTLQQVAERCRVSRRTVYGWAKKGILVPIDPPRPMPGPGLYFDEAAVKEIEQKLQTKISVKAAAEELGIPYGFLRSRITQMGMPSGPLERSWVNDHSQHLIDAYEAVKGKKRRPNLVGHTDKEILIYHKGYRIFASGFEDEMKVRILQVKPLQVRFSDGSISTGPMNIVLEEAGGGQAPYVGSKGHVSLEIPMNESVPADEIYDLLDQLILNHGVKNVRVFWNESRYLILCRPGLLPNVPALRLLFQTYADPSDWLEDEDQIVLGDYDKRIAVPLPYREYLRLEKESLQNGAPSLPQYIASLLIHRKL